MIKHRPTKVARKMRKKRQFKQAAADRTMTAYSKMLAEFPIRRLQLAKREQEERSRRIEARRRPAPVVPKPFLIGGDGK